MLILADAIGNKGEMPVALSAAGVHALPTRQLTKIAARPVTTPRLEVTTPNNT
jgi:hypothetical protein